MAQHELGQFPSVTQGWAGPCCTHWALFLALPILPAQGAGSYSGVGQRLCWEAVSTALLSWPGAGGVLELLEWTQCPSMG